MVYKEPPHTNGLFTFPRDTHFVSVDCLFNATYFVFIYISVQWTHDHTTEFSPCQLLLFF